MKYMLGDEMLTDELREALRDLWVGCKNADPDWQRIQINVDMDKIDDIRFQVTLREGKN